MYLLHMHLIDSIINFLNGSLCELNRIEKVINHKKAFT